MKEKHLATHRNAEKKLNSDDGTLYLTMKSTYDTVNNLMIRHNTYIQTNCVGWIRRHGGTFEQVNKMPRNIPVESVIIICDCVEDMVVKKPVVKKPKAKDVEADSGVSTKSTGNFNR